MSLDSRHRHRISSVVIDPISTFKRSTTTFHEASRLAREVHDTRKAGPTQRRKSTKRLRRGGQDPQLVLSTPHRGAHGQRAFVAARVARKRGTFGARARWAALTFVNFLVVRSCSSGTRALRLPRRFTRTRGDPAFLLIFRCGHRTGYPGVVSRRANERPMFALERLTIRTRQREGRTCT